MAKLIINPTSDAKKEIPVAGRIVSIGRDPTNDLVLSDAMVSRRHAILERRGEQYVLRDNGSSNGTMVNGDRVASEQPLRDGDLIAIGSARFLFQLETSAGTPAAASPVATQPMPVQVPPPASNGITCVACGSQASPTDAHCRHCGKKLPEAAGKQSVCSSCGTTVMLPANFCGSCGKVLLSPVGPAGPASPSGPAGNPPNAPVTPPHLPEPVEVKGDEPRVSTPPGPTSGVSRGTPVSVSNPPAAQAVARKSPAPLRRVSPSPRVASRRPAAGPLPFAGQPAGFWIRLVAHLIDACILSLPIIVASGVWVLSYLAPGTGSAMRGFPPDDITPSLFVLPVVGAVLTLVLSFAYPVYFWAVRGATPGKQVLGLIVVTATGETPIGYQRAVVRLMGYLINGFLLGIGFLLIAVSEDKRGLHDRLADTCVVRRR